MTIEERYKGTVEWFEENMPTPQTELNYESPFELLVAVILSAQCTDKRVNIVTQKLFAELPTVECFAVSSPEAIYEFIKSVTYPNNKAKNLYKMSCQLLDMYNGVIPDDVDELQKLAGVGRKTANVIASVLYDKPAMAVDTHVFRVSERIGLVINSKTPLETERQLVKHIASNHIPKAHHWLILHGRYICTARNPKCSECGIKQWCCYYSIQPN